MEGECHAFGMAVQLRWRLHKVRKAELGRRSARERGGPGEALVEHAAERVEIACGRRLGALDQLRRNVLRRPDDLSVTRELGRVGSPRQPEVRECRDTLAVEEHVGRLHVTVHDPAGVERVEPLPELRSEVDGLGEGKPALGADPVCERPAAVVRHHDEPLPHLEHRHEVARRRCAGEPGLASEALLDDGIAARSTFTATSVALGP